MYYDKLGNEIDINAYVKLARDENYRRVGYTKIGQHVISTVWVGIVLDHVPTGSKPTIFETMVFPNENNFDDQDCERYSEEQDALVGHTRMVYKWANRISSEDKSSM